jgi:hypothetical protein
MSQLPAFHFKKNDSILLVQVYKLEGFSI